MTHDLRFGKKKRLLSRAESCLSFVFYFESWLRSLFMWILWTWSSTWTLVSDSGQKPVRSLFNDIPSCIAFRVSDRLLDLLRDKS